MASVMAIVSKAVFEKMAPGAKPGDVVDGADRYRSGNAAFAKLGPHDAIFLVTVRPPDEKMWLVGVVEGPKLDGDTWIGTNETEIADVTAAIPKLVFATGAGLKPKKGQLGMSLQSPRVLTDGDVALLRGEKTTVTGGQPLLEQAAIAAKKGDAEGAIQRLLEAWRETPAKPIADALDRVSAAALAAGGEGELLEAGRLVDRLRDENAASATGKIAQLSTWEPDPRVGRALVRLLADPPFHATGSQPFWRQVFLLLDKHVDPSSAKELARIPKALDEIIHGASQRGWMKERIEKARAHLEAAPEIDASLADSIELNSTAKRPAARPAKTSDADLFRDVYENPDDDAPRAVLADRLIEKNDPRGTFIALQLARQGRAPTPDERKAERAIVLKHQAAWLGELNPVVELKMSAFLSVGPPDLWQNPLMARWERGFLDGCITKLNPSRVDKLKDSPLWSTISHIRIPEEAAPLLPRLRALRGIHVRDGLFRAVCDSPLAARLEFLRLHDTSDEAWKLVRALPRLRYLFLGTEATAATIERSLEHAQLEELRFELRENDLHIGVARLPKGKHRVLLRYVTSPAQVAKLASVLPVATTTELVIEDYEPKRKVAALTKLFPDAKVTVTDLSGKTSAADT